MRLPRFRATLAWALAAALALLAAGCGKPARRRAETLFPVEAVAAQAQLGVDLRTTGWDCWLPAQSSSPFMTGDWAWVPPGPGAFLLFGSGVRMALAGDSALMFDAKDGSKWLTIARGEATLDGIGREGPRLRTPAATVEVAPGRTAGGGLSIRVDPGGTTTVTVGSGSARLAGGSNAVTVPAGSTSSCEAGGAPSEPVPAQASFTPLSAVGFPYFVHLQTEPYFRNEATRDRAEDDARSKLESAGEDAWSHVNLGRALLDAGDQAGARAQFERALALDSQFSQAFAGLGKAALLEGKWAEAGGAYASARRADPMSLEAVFGMGQSALGGGDLREAEKWFKETLDLDPDGTNPLTGLGIVDLIRQEPDRALRRLEQAASVETTRTRSYPVMAIAHCLRGDLYSARQYLVKALEIDPGDNRARAALASVRARIGDLVAAEAAYKQLTGSGEPGWKAAGYQGTGVIARMQDRPGPALDAWNKSRELSPGRPPVDINAGQARLELKDFEAAVEDFGVAAEADPHLWLPREWLARAYLARGSDPQATAESQSAIALNPGSWISHLVLARSLEGSAPEESRRQLEEAERLKPATKLSASEKGL